MDCGTKVKCRKTGGNKTRIKQFPELGVERKEKKKKKKKKNPDTNKNIHCPQAQIAMLYNLYWKTLPVMLQGDFYHNIL